jgi:hypothetical protein
MYRAIVGALEEKQKQLIRENEDLRRAMRSLQAELQDALNTHFAGAAASESMACVLSLRARASRCCVLTAQQEPVSPARFDMPYDVAGAAIEAALRDRMGLLRRNIARLEQRSAAVAAAGPTESDQAELMAQIGACGCGASVSGSDIPGCADQYKAIISQQDQLLEMRLAAPPTPARFEPPSYGAPRRRRTFVLILVCRTPSDWRRVDRAEYELEQQRIASDAARLTAERVRLMELRSEMERDRLASRLASPAPATPVRSQWPM